MRRRRALAALLASAATVAIAQPQDGVAIVGDVKQAITLSVADLRAFDPKAHRELRERRDAGTVQRDTTLRGVSLAALIEHAGLAERDRLDWRKAVVIAIARDGYRAAFSWPELVNTEGGALVMVAYERDGRALADDEGPLALVAPADQRPGPRRVKWLQRIELRILRD
jgi:DMSO/TMAO reductase YedYZ molybdopterin-dependent catalytic subunit